ncbi:hypothetical protein [Kribbella sp. NPDC050459]|uniref:hypothetical protein n=1 Tax=Kribbella sp. NPDC050459 TaxID=3155785 RepID=UPI0033FEEBBE
MEHTRVTAEELRDALHTAIREHSSGVEWVRWLDASVALCNYSFRNVVLITLQMPYASQVARSEVWRKLGRTVSADEQNREIRILAPVIQQGSRRTVYAASDAELELERGRSARGGGRLVGFKVASVWDISQTDGPALLPASAPAGGASLSDLWRALAHEIHSAGLMLVEGDPGYRNLDGITDHQARTVTIRNGLEDITAVARLAHEVARLRMHNPRAMASPEDVMCRGVREVEAESVAYLLMAHHGWSAGGSSFQYIASWAAAVNRREPEKVIERTGTRVVSVSRRLIESVDRHVRRAGPSQRHASALDQLALRRDATERPFDGPAW